MPLKIASNLKLLKATKKAKLFAGESTFWIPNAAIVDSKIINGNHTIVVNDWIELPKFFKDVSLSELLNEKLPANFKYLTEIEENDFPSDLVQVQKEAVEFCIKMTRSLVWLWTGCGKTKIAIEIANLLHKHGKIKRLYWITPQFDRMQAQLNDSFTKWLNPNIKLHIESINHFSFNFDENINEFDCIIIDECHRVKNGIQLANEAPDCKLANNIRISVKNAGYVYGLTATTCINGILDLFGIFYCIDKSIIIEKDSRIQHYLNVSNQKIKGVKSMLNFLQSVTPYIFHKNRSDYDKRTIKHSDHKLFLSNTQSEAMNHIYGKKKRIGINENSIVDVFSQMSTSCYMSGGDILKKNELIKIIKNADKSDQIIIFGFTVNGKYSDIALIRDAVKSTNESFIELHGEMTEKDNNLAVHLFREGKFRILIASYGCGSESLDFPNANHVVIFGHSLNPIHRFQAIGRIDRLTQKKQCYVYNIYINNSIEGYINNLYERKIDLTSDISLFMKNESETKLLNNEIS